MKVKDIMTRPVICAPAETSTRGVAELLSAHGIDVVPVTDEAGTVIGLVNKHDLVAKTGVTARDVMSPGVISVSEETDLEHVRYLLSERRINGIPVMTGARLVGIVSRADLVRLMAMEWICPVCGEAARAESPPEQCAKCGTRGEGFEQQVQPPGD